MKQLITRFASYLPLIVGIAILVIAAPLVPWGKVWPYLTRLTPLTLLVLLGLSGLFYFGRILRYWLMLRMLEEPVAFGKVALACLVAQPVAVLPGGEMYRSSMLKRYGNVSRVHGIPSVFAQSIAESVGLTLIALIGAALIHKYFALLAAIAIIFIAILLYIRWHNSRQSHKFVNKLPFVSINYRRLKSFLEKNRILLTGSNFFVLVAASYVSTFAGIGIVYVCATAFGAQLDLFQAAVAYALPVALEAVSFLPGGLGVNEGGSISILTLFGLSLPLAVAITLITRLFTLGIGFVFGFGAIAWAHVGAYRRYDHSH